MNGWRSAKHLSIIHSKGYNDSYPIKEWYKGIKNNIR